MLTRAIRSAATARDGTSATVQTLATNVIILALGFGTGVITARLLGPQGRGELAAIAMWPQFLAYALTLGLPSSLLYSLKKSPEMSRELLSASLVVAVALGLMATFAGVVFIPAWLSDYSGDVVRLARWAMIFAPLSLLTVVLLAALQARNEFLPANIARLSPPALSLLFLAALAASASLTPARAAFAILFAGVPSCLWMLERSWRLTSPRLSGTAAAAKLLTTYGIRSYGVDLVNTMAGQIDRIFVVGLLDPKLMGLYVVAVSFSQTINVVPSAVASVLFARQAGRPAENVLVLTGRAVRASIALTMLVAGAIAFLGPVVLGSVYGREYLPALPAFRLLLAEAVLHGAIWVLAQAHMALGRPGLVTTLHAIAIAVRFALLYLLVPRYAILGASLALLASSAVHLAIVLASFPLALKRRPPDLIPRAEDLKALLLATLEYCRAFHGKGRNPL